MFKQCFAPVLALVLTVFTPVAHAYFDLPWITPENPRAGETIYVNIHGGICDVILEATGYPQILQEGNEIRFIVAGAHVEDLNWCIYGEGTYTRPIGSYPPGTYMLTAEMRYTDFFGMPAVLDIGSVSFTVQGLPAAPVPAMGTIAWAVLLALLAVSAIFFLGRGRRIGGLPLLLLAFASPESRANQYLINCTKGGVGAPTPVEIVNWLNANPRNGKPPLTAYSVVAPLGGNYLIPDRATGDFLAWLNQNPQSARAKLERCIIEKYNPVDLSAALTALAADPWVESATEPPGWAFSNVDLLDYGIGIEPEPPQGGPPQYGWFDLNIDAAWGLAGGHALVGQLDSGLDVDGAAFRQFNGNIYAGGGFVPQASKDVGLTGSTEVLDIPSQPAFDPGDVDEAKSMWIRGGACTPNPAQDALLPSTVAGHGTHVAGLIAANGAAGLDVQGTCRNCGLAMWKTTYLICDPSVSPSRVRPLSNPFAPYRAQAQTVDLGIQVMNMSYGSTNPSRTYCQVYRRTAPCLALTHASSRDVAMVASSGNDRNDLNFPASDARVIAAGGFQEDLALWDESPGNTANCPYSPTASECGSDKSVNHGSSGYWGLQELLASAPRVLSTAYPGKNWNDIVGCGDGYGTPMGDGVGLCTGTSMSAPQIAGVLGILRSINPLVPPGDPEPVAPAKPGLRAVLAQTASRVGVWNERLGYGIPDAAKAAQRMLGKVAGATARNRATPLFRLRTNAAKDYAETTSPQYALSLMTTQVHNYVQPATGTGAQPVVPGYTFPYDPENTADQYDTYESPHAMPRAAIYVLATEYKPRPEYPDLVPLYLMAKDKAGGRDHLLATPATMATLHNSGSYRLWTIQGYIYQPCTPESTCIPPYAQKLWRKCKSADNDCATFLESERSAFEGAGYTAMQPTGSSALLGYAYPATDVDPPSDDTLPDALELVIGTRTDAADSDNDGLTDDEEFPLAGVAVSDPCLGGTLGASLCSGDHIFDDGFD